jgi:hypothetical protein
MRLEILYLYRWITIAVHDEETNMFQRGFGFPNTVMNLRIHGDLLYICRTFAFAQISCVNTSDMCLLTFNLSHLLDELPLVGMRVLAFSGVMF